MPTNTIDCPGQIYWSTTTGTNTSTPMTNLDLASINITPNNITWAYDNKEQEEYVEKLEKHIDELEEDIEYFNQQLQEKDGMISHLMGKKTELERNISDMDSHITYIEARLQALEDKVNK